MDLLAIDPATKSLGWAWFKDGRLYKHGSLVVKGTLQKRLLQIYEFFSEMSKETKFDYVITERMNFRTHYTVNFAIGVIYIAFTNAGYVGDDLSPNTWKAYFGLKQRDKGKKIKNVFRKLFKDVKIETDDEIEAILMGLCWLKKERR